VRSVLVELMGSVLAVHAWLGAVVAEFLLLFT
jgi:hypothetical protein